MLLMIPATPLALLTTRPTMMMVATPPRTLAMLFPVMGAFLCGLGDVTRRRVGDRGYRLADRGSVTEQRGADRVIDRRGHCAGRGPRGEQRHPHVQGEDASQRDTQGGVELVEDQGDSPDDEHPRE